jgi:hypothetical protein
MSENYEYNYGWRSESVPYLCHVATDAPSGGPRAPQGPSDEELQRTNFDPRIPPFGASGSVFSDLVMGRLMSPGTAVGVISITPRRK